MTPTRKQVQDAIAEYGLQKYTQGYATSAGSSLEETDSRIESDKLLSVILAALRAYEGAGTVDRVLLVQAVARGWCAPKTSHKVMDCDLVEAIADEVEVMIAATPLEDGSAVEPNQVRSDEPVAWRDAFYKARDIVLNERGPLAENGMTNDQVNAVLSVLDDSFVPILKRPAQSHVAPEIESLRAELARERDANARLQELHTGLMKNADNMNDELRAANAKLQDALHDLVRQVEVFCDKNGEADFEVYTAKLALSSVAEVTPLSSEAVPVQQPQP